MSLTAIFLLSAFLLSCGVTTMLVRRNAIQVLMGVELALNAASLNFIGVSQLGLVSGNPVLHAASAGQVFTLFIIIIAACEAAVALAIILGLFNQLKSVLVTDAQQIYLLVRNDGDFTFTRLPFLLIVIPLWALSLSYD